MTRPCLLMRSGKWEPAGRVVQSVLEELDVDDILGPEAVDFLYERFAAAAPFQRFLVESCGLDF